MASKKEKAPVHSLTLFLREGNKDSEAFAKIADKIADDMDLPLSRLDVMADENERAIFGFNVCHVPLLLLLRDGRKCGEFTDEHKVSAITAKITKLITPK